MTDLICAQCTACLGTCGAPIVHETAHAQPFTTSEDKKQFDWWQHQAARLTLKYDKKYVVVKAGVGYQAEPEDIVKDKSRIVGSGENDKNNRNLRSSRGEYIPRSI